MKKNDIANFWASFLRWRGWRTLREGCVRCWQVTAGWRGWRRLFRIPMPLLLILCAVCAAALVWVFASGREEWVPAYLLYALSAYALTALCVKLPAALGEGRAWMDRHPKVKALLNNEKLKFTLELYVEQFINFAYGIFKIVSGVVMGSAWIGCDGIYNLAQALIQLFQILRRKKPGTLRQQWQSYRVCGVLVLLMHLTLTGIVFQMVNWNRAEEHGQIMIFATAAFAFYKLTVSFIDIARDRKHTYPIDSSVRMLELSQAIFSIFSLQASLLHTFGTGEAWEGWMNMATGCVVCLLVAAMGVYMLRRGNREIRKLQETENG